MIESEQYKIQAFERRLAGSLQENCIDCVILGYDGRQLKVLLLKWKYEEVWSLPGGYIHLSEDLDEAAHRILEERTGLGDIFLKQFHTFGSAQRMHKNHSGEVAALKRIMKKIPLKDKEWDFEWFIKRFVTTGYFALVYLETTKPMPDFFSERCEWTALSEVPKLLADHNQILDTALEYLRRQLNYLPIGMSLLPEKFTMQDLQKLYEVILGKPLVRSNFQRKILKLGILIRHEKLMTGAANKAPYLYSFHRERYREVVRNGIGFSY